LFDDDLFDNNLLEKLFEYDLYEIFCQKKISS
jgi:hypothetical protein